MYENINQPEEMRERYKALPTEITELFEYGTVDFVLNNLAQEFALGDEQKEALRMEIELVLYFFLPRMGLVERLQDSLEIDRVKAEQIYAYVEENLFIIVDDILTFTDKELKDDTETEEAVPVAQVALPATEKPIAPAPLPPSGKPSFITKVDTPPAKPIAPEKPPQAETPHSNVRPLRTFAEDVELSRAHSYGAFRSNTREADDDEPVHRSSQDDIIKK